MPKKRRRKCSRPAVSSLTQLGTTCSSRCCSRRCFSFFFFNDTATTEIYTLSLHDALPIDLAEQTLAVQRQLALTLTGLASRQLETTVDTGAETVDTTVEAAAPAVETVQGTVRERARQVEAELKGSPERVEQPQGDQDDAPKAEPPKQDRRPDRRTYEERTVEELRERAGELQIEGRSTMSKDELIAALRNHRKSRSAKTDAAKSQPPTQDRPADRRSYEERSIEELRERARELEIEGRSSMTKDELIAALRGQAK